MSRIPKPFAGAARRAICALAVAASLSACDSVKPSENRARDMAVYDFTSAIRWGDWDAAYDFVDPETKKEHPLTDIDRGRFKQLEVSAYDAIAKSNGPGTMDRQIKLELINKNTQIPRSIVYHEHWRWDEGRKKWWLQSGLPDLSPQE